MLNRVVLIGRITRDIEKRVSKNGKSFCYFTLAVNRNKEQTDFIDCVAWEKVADSMEKYLSKGALIAVEGLIQSRNVTQGAMRTKVTDVRATSVKFLQAKNTFNQPSNFQLDNQQPIGVDENAFDIDSMSFDFVEQNNSDKSENNNMTFDNDDAIAWGE